MNRVVLVTRHAQSCNNAAQPLKYGIEKFMEPLLTDMVSRVLLKDHY